MFWFSLTLVFILAVSGTSSCVHSAPILHTWVHNVGGGGEWGDLRDGNDLAQSAS